MAYLQVLCYLLVLGSVYIIYIQHYTLDGCFMSCASRVDFVQKRQEKIEAKKMPTVAALWLFQLTVSGSRQWNLVKTCRFCNYKRSCQTGENLLDMIWQQILFKYM